MPVSAGWEQGELNNSLWLHFCPGASLASSPCHESQQFNAFPYVYGTPQVAALALELKKEQISQ